MTALCDTIDTLAMVYLDDELDDAERRELELHVHECGPCRDHIAAERASRVALRAMLAPPPAPALLRARIGRALAVEDKRVAAANRSGMISRWLLPGAAVAAAAAALVLVVATPSRDAAQGGEGRRGSGEVARAAMKVQSTSRPLEVQGVATGPWLAQHFEADVAVPEFDDSSVRVVGARLVQITGYEAAQIFYEVVAGPTRLELSAFVLKGVHRGDLRGSRKVEIDGHELWVTDADGPTGRTSIVSYEDPDGNGYVFMSQAFGAQALVQVVIGSDLIRRSGERIR